MKCRWFVSICLVVISALFPSAVQACELYNRPKYVVNFEIDINTEATPGFVIDSSTMAADSDGPRLRYTGGDEIIILSKDTTGEVYPGVPKGYKPFYRLTAKTSQLYIASTHQWSNFSSDRIVLRSYIYDPGGYSNTRLDPYQKPNYPFKPIEKNAVFYLARNGSIIPVQLRITYNLDPTYDPYLYSRPDNICGSPFSNIPIINSLAYSLLMLLGVVMDFQNTRDIYFYDLSHKSLNAYVLTAMLLVVFGLFLLFLRYVYRKRSFGGSRKI